MSDLRHDKVISREIKKRIENWIHLGEKGSWAGAEEDGANRGDFRNSAEEESDFLLFLLFDRWIFFEQHYEIHIYQ